MVFVQTNPFRTQDAQYAREQTVRLPVARRYRQDHRRRRPQRHLARGFQYKKPA